MPNTQGAGSGSAPPTANTRAPLFFAELPKCELHVHLEGTLLPEKVKAMSTSKGLLTPDIFENHNGYKDIAGLYNLFAICDSATAVMREANDLAETYIEYVKKASAQNIIHAEIFFSPHIRSGNRRRVPLKKILEAFGRANVILNHMPQIDITVGFIICFSRGRLPLEADEILTELHGSPFKELVVGVGLDCKKRTFPAIDFKDVFARAKQMGLKTAIHCDITKPDRDIIEQIRQAIFDIGVDRIIHGSSIVEDPSLLQQAIEKKIGITCCPFTNLLVGPDFNKYEIKRLLETEALLSIGSDHPAFLPGYLINNIYKIINEGHMPQKFELIKAAENSITSAWVTEGEKQDMLNKQEAYIKGYKLISSTADSGPHAMAESQPDTADEQQSSTTDEGEAGDHEQRFGLGSSVVGHSY
ncbi:hypothetical protein ABW21_db0207395 [Orbilia brochopaga]|nr:hypothetical protein ABW21_db0207395 [Drechslerella brochopaga]